MRAVSVWTVAVALLAAACGTAEGERGDGPQADTTVTTSPETTAPSTPDRSSTTTAADPDVPAPVAPDDGSEPVGDEGEGTVVTTHPPKEDVVKPIQPVEPHPSGPVAGAVADLAARLGVAESDVAVISFEEVTWPDGSIGCPQPGMSYTQALVNGSLIVLQVGGVNHEYHSGGARDLFYCATPTPPVPGEYGDT